MVGFLKEGAEYRVDSPQEGVSYQQQVVCLLNGINSCRLRQIALEDGIDVQIVAESLGDGL